MIDSGYRLGFGGWDLMFSFLLIQLLYDSPDGGRVGKGNNSINLLYPGWFIILFYRIYNIPFYLSARKLK